MHYKLEHYKISKLLNDLTISKFATMKVNYLSSGQYFVSKRKEKKRKNIERIKKCIINWNFIKYLNL